MKFLHKQFKVTVKVYSLNVKRVKWLLFKRVESVKTTLIEWKSPSKRVKIIPKRVKIAPKRVKITPKEWILLLRGSSLRDNSFVSSCPYELPQEVKFTLLEWFSLSLEQFSLALDWFSLFLRVIFTRLECFLCFPLFRRVTISLCLHKEMPKTKTKTNKQTNKQTKTKKHRLFRLDCLQALKHSIKYSHILSYDSRRFSKNRQEEENTLTFRLKCIVIA